MAKGLKIAFALSQTDTTKYQQRWRGAEVRLRDRLLRAKLYPAKYLSPYSNC